MKILQQSSEDMSRELGDLRQQVLSLEQDLQQDIKINRDDVAVLNDQAERVSQALNAVESLDGRLATIEADIIKAQDTATNANQIAASVRWIVTIVSILISGLTVVLGLFFSQRFVDLKTDAKVAHAVMERIEKQLQRET